MTMERKVPTLSDTPTVAWAKPADARVAWQVYLNGAIKVRQLNSGVVQFATGENEWEDAQ